MVFTAAAGKGVEPSTGTLEPKPNRPACPQPVPALVETICTRKGAMWTPTERQKVLDWVLNDPQLRRLNMWVYDRLSPNGRHPDAEAVVIDYLAESWLIQVERYDPEKGNPRKSPGTRFWDHLFQFLCQRCQDSKSKLDTRHAREELLDPIDDGPNGYPPIDAKAPSPEDEAIRSEESKTIHEAIIGLSEKYKPVVVLYYLEECGIAEIADRLGISSPCVKMRLSRGRRALRAMLRQSKVQWG